MSFGSIPSNQPFTFNVNFGAPPPFPARGSSQTFNLRPPALCDDCSTLDLETAFARANTLYEQARRGNNIRRLVTCCSKNGTTYLRDFYFVTSLNSRLSEQRSCKLCDFLKEHVGDPSKGTYKLLVICSSETTLFEAPRKSVRGQWIHRPWDNLEYNVFLAVVPEVEGIPRTGVPLRWLETELPQKGSIYRLTKDLREEEGMRLVLPQELEPKVDLVQADYWLSTCQKLHKPCCAPRKPEGATLRGFRAINCFESPINVEEGPYKIEELSWSEKYVALSYVWGPSTEKWPQTVRDAVAVTRMLGEKYLWVDRVCINQSDLEEKMFLVSKMDAIYEGAEFTIVNAAGDARTGLPGVGKTPRASQHRVELDISKRRSVQSGHSEDAYLELFNVPKTEYEVETEGHSMWLDTYRHGLNGTTMQLGLDELMSLGNSRGRAEKYGIPQDHLDYHESTAEHYNTPFDEYMEKQQELAHRIGITLPELVPYLYRQAAKKAGIPIADDEPLPPVDTTQHVTNPRKTERPLPPGLIPGKTVLVSTMQEPRMTIRKSQWATRGWTYQEGVLSNRCLVFTGEQMYWECRGMAVNESIRLPLPSLHLQSESVKHYYHFADYMLSGIFRGDMHRVPELQYGFQPEDTNNLAKEIETINGHIRGFTSRNLTDPGDSLNAFLGVSSSISKKDGLSLMLGIPVWAGPFADGQPGLQHTFALSISIWFHLGKLIEAKSELFVANCHRRSQYPSWSWIGWEGRVDFNGDNNDYNEPHEVDEDNYGGDNFHIDFFTAMMKTEWVKSINRIWSAEMILHSEDRKDSTLLYGSVSIEGFADHSKKWLLTIQEPLVLKHMHLMHSSNDWEWKRLMGKLATLRLSTPFTEEELTRGHKSGDMVTVLMFASTVSFVWDGRARFLILRQVDGVERRWERIGSLVLTIEEWVMGKYKNSQDMIKDLPVIRFRDNIVIV
ncbi:uncharacterized protein PAC_19856 [Phialocephala subalpina]|uniref:Heterokaryon incompatibility domain-containing protein n=1 Tax=Phialocephala subalpina TaxID=576137 RepID=A0A1L7XYE3_9HELO|nr:uncharacterized protein PAC_19856 [Phialocephala subalpina]